MRSKPKKPNRGLVVAALISLAAIWLIFGTVLLLGFKYWVTNNTVANDEDRVFEDPIEQPIEEPYEEDVDVLEKDPADHDDLDDQDLNDDDSVDSTKDPDDDDSDDPGDDDPDDDDSGDTDDADHEEDDEDDGSETFTVDAWDGFAAVRSGRGTNYKQVGRLNNGEKVKVTDLENGWYKISSGKWKGYYLHRSSLRK